MTQTVCERERERGEAFSDDFGYSRCSNIFLVNMRWKLIVKQMFHSHQQATIRTKGTRGISVISVCGGMDCYQLRCTHLKPNWPLPGSVSVFHDAYSICFGF